MYLAFVGIVALLLLSKISTIEESKSSIELDNKDSVDFIETRELESSDYWDLGSAITIDDLATGIDAHNWSWAVSQDWCSGSGIKGDPFLIENISISLSGGAPCLNISNSNSTTYVTINNCTLTDSAANGIGIYLNNVSNVLISSCNCSTNGDTGISIIDSDNCTIYLNTIASNTNYGLLIDEIAGDSLTNLVYYNDFDDNGVNANDSCAIANSWDNNTVGNDWDAYGFAQYDGNDDNIGDVAYDIPGTAGAKDRFPIFSDGAEPIIILDDDDDYDDLFADEKNLPKLEINWIQFGMISLIVIGASVVIFVQLKFKIVKPRKIRASIKRTTHNVKAKTKARVKK